MFRLTGVVSLEAIIFGVFLMDIDYVEAKLQTNIIVVVFFSYSICLLFLISVCFHCVQINLIL